MKYGFPVVSCGLVDLFRQPYGPNVGANFGHVRLTRKASFVHLRRCLDRNPLEAKPLIDEDPVLVETTSQWTSLAFFVRRTSSEIAWVTSNRPL